jgi:hypothetical protein
MSNLRTFGHHDIQFASNKNYPCRPPQFWRVTVFTILFWAAVVLSASAQDFRVLAEFAGNDGDGPYFMSLVQGPDGNFYGVTESGGAKQ